MRPRGLRAPHGAQTGNGGDWTVSWLMAVVCMMLPARPMSYPRLEPHDPVVRVETPARTLMPIWVRIECVGDADPFGHSRVWPVYPAFPFVLHDGDLADYDLELRCEGKTVPPFDAGWSRSPVQLDSPGPDTAHPGRVPLHLRYRITEPGRYQVRLVQAGRMATFKQPPSPWTAFDVVASTEAEREAFRRQAKEAAQRQPRLGPLRPPEPPPAHAEADIPIDSRFIPA